MKQQPNLTKREYFAAKAMQGVIAKAQNGNLYNPKEGVRLAVEWAYSLMNELGSGEVSGETEDVLRNIYYEMQKKLNVLRLTYKAPFVDGFAEAVRIFCVIVREQFQISLDQ